MDHQTAKDLIWDAYDKELPPLVVSQIKEHLKACDACRTQWEEWSKLSSSLLKKPAISTPPHFTEDIMARICEEMAPAPLPWKFHWNFRIPSLALAGAALLAALIVIPRVHQPATPAAVAQSEPEFSSELMEISFIPHAEDESNLGTQIEEYFL